MGTDTALKVFLKIVGVNALKFLGPPLLLLSLWYGVKTAMELGGDLSGDRPVKMGTEAAELQKKLDRQDKFITDPREREEAKTEIINRQRKVDPPPEKERPTREAYGIYLAGQDVFVGQKSVIEAAPVSTIILWGRDPNKKVKDVATVANFHPEGKTFATWSEAWEEYTRLKTEQGPAHPAFRSWGRVARFAGCPANPQRKDGRYFINNEERFRPQ
jgi:hypothetical protein